MMNEITLDAATAAKLLTQPGPVRVSDEAGRILGHFIPARPDPALYEGLEPDISTEELDRRSKETKRYTTAQVLAHLEKL
jgi:hypothetical protein